MFNCAVATASQAKASAFEKETLTMADFAETTEKSAIMDVGIAVCRTAAEKIHGRGRLVLVGSREGQDLLTVGCRIDPARSMILSDGLYDAFGRSRPITMT